MIVCGSAGLEQQRLRERLAAGVVQPQLMVWRYDAPALVLGRGQRAMADVRTHAGRAGVPVIDRVSGGGAVIAGPWMLSVTLLLPSAHALAAASLPAGYRAIGEGCGRALRRMGVPVQIAASGAGHVTARPTPDDAVHWACFAQLSHGELAVAGSRKIVGIAQVRRRDAVAACIGVLVGRPDWGTLVRVWLGRDAPTVVRELERRTASCAEFVAARDSTFVAALAAELASELPTPRLAA